jgi:hypothetical protein
MNDMCRTENYYNSQFRELVPTCIVVVEKNSYNVSRHWK